MKISLKKYLLYSSVLAVFTEAFSFKLLIDWKLFYLIIFINYPLLLKLKGLKFNKYFVLLLLGLLIHGITTYTIINIPYKYLISQLLGVTIVGTYFYNLVSLYEKKELIDTYLKLSLYVALIGFPMWLLGINSNDGIRFQSIFTEPAHYAIVVIPAVYYCFHLKKYLSFFMILISILLSQSSIGYIGLSLMLIIPQLSLRRIAYFAILIPVVIGVFYLLYRNNDSIKLRFDDTYNSISALKNGKFKDGTNESSYALLSNLYVAKNNFLNHPLGSGFGSHFSMHTNEYSKIIRPPYHIDVLKLDKINAPDAASLFIRILSDLGIIGVLLMLFLMFKSSKVFQYELLFEQGIFIYLLLKLFRDGHYFPPEFYFFVWLLYFSLYKKDPYNNPQIV